MQLVVEISEKEYNRIQAMDWKNGDKWYEEPIRAIHYGTPLPKGHGRLKDIDKFLKSVEKDRMHECYMCSWTVDDVLQKLDSWYAPTIIEADKESEV